LGLPHESKEFLAKSAHYLSNLRIDFLKLHHLQVIKDTKLAEMYSSNPDLTNLLTKDSYQKLLLDFIPYLSQNIYIERFLNRVPTKYLIAPRWGGITETKFRQEILSLMEKNNTYQGKMVTADFLAQ
jgi:hypothetical protein